MAYGWRVYLALVGEGLKKPKCCSKHSPTVFLRAVWIGILVWYSIVSICLCGKDNEAGEFKAGWSSQSQYVSRLFSKLNPTPLPPSLPPSLPPDEMLVDCRATSPPTRKPNEVRRPPPPPPTPNKEHQTRYKDRSWSFTATFQAGEEI